MIEPELQKLCRLWQKRLRLQDWTVNAIFNSQQETWGLNEFSDLYKRSLITIHADGPEGDEFYLVHELVHLYGLMDDPQINRITRAFMQAYSGVREPKEKS